MANYYPIQRYGATYVPRYYRDEVEYPGYDNTWVLGREREGYYHDDYSYRRPFPSLNYSSYQYPSSRLEYYPQSRYHRNGLAHLAWATEVPVRLRVTICCEGCKLKLDRALRNMHGKQTVQSSKLSTRSQACHQNSSISGPPCVHDVGISGWTNAVVTVTGTAPARKLLKKARKVSKSAEFWIDSTYPNDYDSSYRYSRHH